MFCFKDEKQREEMTVIQGGRGEWGWADRNLDLPEPNSCLVLKKSGLKEQQQESEAGLLVTMKMWMCVWSVVE